MAGVLLYVHDQSRTCPYKVNPQMEMKNGRTFVYKKERPFFHLPFHVEINGVFDMRVVSVSSDVIFFLHSIRLKTTYTVVI
jgi:hypothetical protein